MSLGTCAIVSVCHHGCLPCTLKKEQGRHGVLFFHYASGIGGVVLAQLFSTALGHPNSTTAQPLLSMVLAGEAVHGVRHGLSHE